MYVNIIKAIYDMPTANLILSDEKLSLLMKGKVRMPTLTTSIKYSTGSHNQSN
jgi:hypothetical protein